MRIDGDICYVNSAGVENERFDKGIVYNGTEINIKN